MPRNINIQVVGVESCVLLPPVSAFLLLRVFKFKVQRFVSFDTNEEHARFVSVPDVGTKLYNQGVYR